MLYWCSTVIYQLQHFLRLRLIFRTRVNLNAIKIIKSLKSTIGDERLRGAGLFSLEKRRPRGSMITVFKYMTGHCREEEDEPLLVSYFLAFESSPARSPNLRFILFLVLL